MLGRAPAFFWIRGMSWECARRSVDGTLLVNTGPHGELFFFVMKKEPTIFEEVVDFERVTSSETEDGESFSGEDGEHNVDNFVAVPLA